MNTWMRTDSGILIPGNDPDTTTNYTSRNDDNTPPVTMASLCQFVNEILEKDAALNRGHLAMVKQALNATSDKPVTDETAEIVARGKRFNSPYLPEGTTGFTDGRRFVLIRSMVRIKPVARHRKQRKGRRQ